MYYWRVYIRGTGEIMEQGHAPSPEKAQHFARALIEHYRWFDEPDEQYEIEIYEGSPSEGPQDSSVRPVMDKVSYRRRSRRYKE
ncbi:MAG: hypothetical protein ACXABY_34300 [Candidatus Thorarchaeota archaeon]|jgi:hypothetical protein